MLISSSTLISSRQVWKICPVNTQIFILFLYIFHLAIRETNAYSDNNYNKVFFCTRNEDCDQDPFLQCISNVCVCSHEDYGMVWVPKENSCMIKEGFHCKRDTWEPKCVPNASCNNEKCECNYEFLRNGYGHCELSYGNTCSESEKCAVRYLLECVKPVSQDSNNRLSKCRCRGEGTELVWDDLKRKCVSTAGGPCDTFDDEGYEKDDQLECIQNAECVSSGQCRCKNGFTQTPEGTCMLGFGQKCNDVEGFRCNRHENLICQQGVCECDFYGQMDYDYEIKQCRILVGESCDPTNPNNIEHDGNEHYYPNEFHNTRVLKCVKDAFCKRRRGSSRGTCVCENGFETSASRKCTKERGHGLPCSASMDCDKSKFLECLLDDDGLGHCGCINNQMVFDGNECRVRPGKRCSGNKLCAKNAYCEGDWCICKEGFVIDIHENGCQKSPARQAATTELTQNVSVVVDNTSASHKDDLENCNRFEIETLDWKKCLCQQKSNSHVWFPLEYSCAALVGTQCKIDDECIPNAICDPDMNICQCLVTARTTENRTCVTTERPLHEHRIRDCLDSESASSYHDLQQTNAGNAKRVGTAFLSSQTTLLTIVTFFQYSFARRIYRC